MFTAAKNYIMRFLDPNIDFRVRLFNVLAIAGAAISTVAFTINIITSMTVSAIICALLALLSGGLLIYTYRTGKYQNAYVVTIVSIFMFFFPAMFFTSGGYKSGMPSLFIFAVMFTVLMLSGKKALIVSAAEIFEYITVCIIGYKKPELVTWFQTDYEMLADILVTTSAVSISCAVVLFLHLGEYQQQRNRLAEQNEQLKRNDEAKSVFLTTVAHEIKNPLNAINLHARDTFELLDEHDLDIDTMKENQQVVEKMVMRLDRIVAELMDTVAIEQGRLALSLSPVNLGNLVREAAQTYFGKNNTNGNTLSFDLDSQLEPISADGARIMQVVTNLISNSMQHTRNGVVTVRLTGSKDGRTVTVSDNGTGMTDDIKNKVFDGYVSVSKEYWRHGIGLFVCRQIIEAHGGKIQIESEIGKGTTVSFTLPAAD